MVEPKRKISKNKYLLAFFISSSIFIIGILVGALITNAKYSSLDLAMQDIRAQILSLETQYAIAENNPCSFVNFEDLSKELYFMGDSITLLEGQVGKTNNRVLELVKYYSILEIKHYLFLKSVNEKCDKNYRLVLFFYSNDEDKCGSCGQQGYILSFLRKKYPNLNIHVYSFNSDIDSPAVETLKHYYNITLVPSIVINENTYSGYSDVEFIESTLKSF